MKGVEVMSKEHLQKAYIRNRKPLKLITILLAVIAGFGVFLWQAHRAQTEQAANWGMADAKEINVNSKVAGRVVELCVEEGQHVEKGQVIARIDRDMQEPQQRQAQAALAAQYAQLQQTVLASQSAEGTLAANLHAAQAKAAQAGTAVSLAAKDEARYRSLLEASAVSQQTYDTYRSRLEDAQAVLASANAGVASAQASLLKNQENKSIQEAAQAQAEAMQGQLDAVNVNLAETEIRAPFSGVITRKYVEEGALISPTVPLYALQDAGDNWVDFKVKETDLKNYVVGEQVELIARDEQTRFTGTIESIRRKGDFATQKATSERGEADIIAFNVKVRTNNDSIWPGMRFRLLH